MHSSTTVRPAHDANPRRGPRWWWIVLVQVAGCWAAVFLASFAWFSLPKYGLFGVENDDGTQVLGALAAIGAVLCLLSGPLSVACARTRRLSARR